MPKYAITEFWRGWMQFEIVVEAENEEKALEQFSALQGEMIEWGAEKFQDQWITEVDEE